MSSSKICRLALLLALHLPLLVSCAGGDDDGRRLGELIVGTWQCGAHDGDIVIEGTTELKPENLSIDRFVFRADGSYNGMVRTGTFTTTDMDGDTGLEGDYKCDNSTLRLESGSLAIVARIASFTDDTIRLRYVNQDWDATIELTLRRLSE